MNKRRTTTKRAPKKAPARGTRVTRADLDPLTTMAADLERISANVAAIRKKFGLQ